MTLVSRKQLTKSCLLIICKDLWTYMEHEFRVCMDKFDQREEEALITSSVEVCSFLLELQASGPFSNECQTLQDKI